MLESLRFVQGAVAKKDYVAALTHFDIRGGVIRGYNGMLALSCPIDLDLDVSPKALPFVKAIQACKDDAIAMHMTPTGRLSIKSGGFKANIECINEPFPDIAPEGAEIELHGELLGVLKKLNPFIGEDASRPWARGILLRGQSAYATNNVSLIEHWIGYEFPVVINIPKTAVAELLRIDQEPERLQLSENNITFHFSGNRWLRTQSYPTDWPDFNRIFDRPATLAPIPEGLFDAIESLAPFLDELGRVFLAPGTVTTGEGETATASVEIPTQEATGIYHHKQLLLLDGIADRIDLSAYPAPCLFQGENLRGAIVGMRI